MKVVWPAGCGMAAAAGGNPGPASGMGVSDGVRLGRGVGVMDGVAVGGRGVAVDEEVEVEADGEADRGECIRHICGELGRQRGRNPGEELAGEHQKREQAEEREDAGAVDFHEFHFLTNRVS